MKTSRSPRSMIIVALGSFILSDPVGWKTKSYRFCLSYGNQKHTDIQIYEINYEWFMDLYMKYKLISKCLNS